MRNPKGLPVSAPLVSPVVLLLNDTYILWYGNCVKHQHTSINTNSIDKTLTPITNNLKQKRTEHYFDGVRVAPRY